MDAPIPESESFDDINGNAAFPSPSSLVVLPVPRTCSQNSDSPEPEITSTALDDLMIPETSSDYERMLWSFLSDSAQQFRLDELCINARQTLKAIELVFSMGELYVHITVLRIVLTVIPSGASFNSIRLAQMSLKSEAYVPLITRIIRLFETLHALTDKVLDLCDLMQEQGSIFIEDLKPFLFDISGILNFDCMDSDGAKDIAMNLSRVRTPFSGVVCR